MTSDLLLLLSRERKIFTLMTPDLFPFPIFTTRPTPSLRPSTDFTGRLTLSQETPVPTSRVKRDLS